MSKLAKGPAPKRRKTPDVPVVAHRPHLGHLFENLYATLSAQMSRLRQKAEGEGLDASEVRQLGVLAGSVASLAREERQQAAEAMAAAEEINERRLLELVPELGEALRGSDD